MDPQVPTQRALAIAGERIAGGVGVHETALASPDVVDLGGRVVAARASPTRTSTSRPGRSRRRRSRSTAARSLDEALARIGDAERRARRRDPRATAGAAATGRRRGADGRAARRGDRRRRPAAMIAKDYHSLWLNSAALALAGGDLEVEGGVVERDARRRADGRAARGGGVAVQGAAPRRSRRRLRRRDARRA